MPPCQERDVDPAQYALWCERHQFAPGPSLYPLVEDRGGRQAHDATLSSKVDQVDSTCDRQPDVEFHPVTAGGVR